jgi:hypothetical protein
MAAQAAQGELSVDRREFRKRVKPDANGCWIWQGGRLKSGYGCLQHTQFRTTRAHRIAWALWRGDPGALGVLHRCDVKLCCNPRHLFLGTQKDNIQDASMKGRLKRSAEWREKLGQRRRGAKASSTTIAKLRGNKNCLGRQLSAETREKIRRSVTASWPKRRSNGSTG